MKGTIQVLSNWVGHRELHRLQRVFIVPTAVPQFMLPGRAPDELERRLRKFEKDVRELNGMAKRDRKTLRDDWIVIESPIPESDDLKWDDRIVTDQPSTDGMRDLVAAYGLLAARLREEREALQ